MNICANHAFQDKGTNSWGRGDHTPFIRFVQFTRKLLSMLCWFIMNDPAWQITSGRLLAEPHQDASCIREQPRICWANGYLRKPELQVHEIARITATATGLKIWCNCGSGAQKITHNSTVLAVATTKLGCEEPDSTRGSEKSLGRIIEMLTLCKVPPLGHFSHQEISLSPHLQNETKIYIYSFKGKSP